MKRMKLAAWIALPVIVICLGYAIYLFAEGSSAGATTELILLMK